jgi:branched-chain amino acid transport system permease protein
MKSLRFDLAWGAVALVAALLVGAVGSDYMLGIAFNLAMWVALTQSWSILSAMTGYVSLGHAVFYGIGAYALVLTMSRLSLPLALVCAAFAAAATALVVGYPVLRVRGPYFVILTFGLAELIKHIVMQVETGLGQFSRLIFDAPSLNALYWMMLGLAVLATLGVALIRPSTFGRGLIAIREDEEAAEAIGVPVRALKLTAFALSAVIPGVVGGLVTLRTSYFEPTQAFNPVISFTIVTMAVVGGTDRPRGPVIGAIAFVLLSELLWARFPQLYMIIVGALLVLFILFLPRGLSGLFDRRKAA